jgi:hypothetical protein
LAEKEKRITKNCQTKPKEVAKDVTRKCFAKKKQVMPCPASYDEGLQKRLWKKTESMLGLAPE